MSPKGFWCSSLSWIPLFECVQTLARLARKTCEYAGKESKTETMNSRGAIVKRDGASGTRTLEACQDTRMATIPSHCSSALPIARSSAWALWQSLHTAGHDAVAQAYEKE